MTEPTFKKNQTMRGCGIALLGLILFSPLLSFLIPLNFWYSPTGVMFRRILARIGIRPPVLVSPTPFSHAPDPQTRAQMMNLKAGLVNYISDVGPPPFVGPTMSSGSLELADFHCLGTTFAKNILVNDTVGKPFENLGLPILTYRKRWKGPYMDDDPSRFMVDTYGRKISWEFRANSVYLHATGPDGIRDALASASLPGYSGDDSVLLVSRIKLPKPLAEAVSLASETNPDR